MSNEPMTLSILADKWAPGDRLGRAAFETDVLVLIANERAARKTESAPKAVTGTNGNTLRSGVVFPNFGRTKGLPIEEGSKQDLMFYSEACRRSLEDPSKARWHDKERALLAALQKELATR